MKREFLSVALIGSVALAGGPALAGWRTVSLHPTDAQYLSSNAAGVSGGQIGGVGFISEDNEGPRSALWNGPSSAGFVSLAAIPSEVRGVSGGIQVGDLYSFGAFWKGTTDWHFVEPGADSQGRHLWGIAGGWAVGQEMFISNPTQSHPTIWQLMDTNSGCTAQFVGELVMKAA